MLVKKLGHPVPLSYFICDVNNGRLQPAHTNTPARFSLLSGLVNGVSVPSSRSTLYCAGVSNCRHTALLRSTGSVETAISAFFASSVLQVLRISSIAAASLAVAAKAGRAPSSAASVNKKWRRCIDVLVTFALRQTP